MLGTFADLFSQSSDAIGENQRRMEEKDEDSSVVWQGQDFSTLEPEEMEDVLADTILKEFKTRLNRIGIEYQTPEAA